MRKFITSYVVYPFAVVWGIFAMFFLKRDKEAMIALANEEEDERDWAYFGPYSQSKGTSIGGLQEYEDQMAGEIKE